MNPSAVTTIHEIKQGNKARGYHFFDADTLRFFGSRISSEVFTGPGGVYFVTSEARPASFLATAGTRLYTVRAVGPDFEVETAPGCSFQQFRSLSGAKACAKRLAEGGGEPSKCRGCGSKEPMSLDSVQVNGQAMKGFRCDSCGHVHLVTAKKGGR